MQAIQAILPRFSATLAKNKLSIYTCWKIAGFGWIYWNLSRTKKENTRRQGSYCQIYMFKNTRQHACSQLGGQTKPLFGLVYWNLFSRAEHDNCMRNKFPLRAVKPRSAHGIQDPLWFEHEAVSSLMGFVLKSPLWLAAFLDWPGKVSSRIE